MSKNNENTDDGIENSMIMKTYVHNGKLLTVDQGQLRWTIAIVGVLFFALGRFSVFYA